GFQQAVLIEAIGLAYEAFEAVAVHGPLENALRHRDEYLGRGGGTHRCHYPGKAQRVRAERRILAAKKLLDALFAAQALAAFSTATGQYVAAVSGFHTVAETVLVAALALRGLVGRYELQNFAQKIQRVEVSDAETDEPLPYRKVTKDRWEVPSVAGRSVRVRYNFYAHQMDAGGSWLDETQLYLNPVQALMYAEGHQDLPCQLSLVLPPDWRLA
nr:hypothetical protein [Tanacetum cinerariifolium]